jgi:putative inorganic carbon (hco3(-)) transporter
MKRLSGSPHDVINPNGLAYVILTFFALTISLVPQLNYLFRVAYGAISLVILYALYLTGSRTGLVGLLLLVCLHSLSRKASKASVIIILLVALIPVTLLDELQTSRFASMLFDTQNPFSSSAEHRISGVRRHFGVAMERPIFGHGLGTSIEANFYSTGVAIVAHNLYVEVLQETGVVGCGIFLLFLYGIFVHLRRAYLLLPAIEDAGSKLSLYIQSLFLWFWVSLVFSLASYGLSSYEWYFLAGLACVVHQLAMDHDIVSLISRNALI